MLQNLTAALSNDDARYVIRLANSLYLQEGVTFNPEFLHLMRKYFRADVETVDFSESAAVADQINSWVENRTESKSEEREGWKKKKKIPKERRVKLLRVTCNSVRGFTSLYKNKKLLNAFQSLSCTNPFSYPYVENFKSCITAGCRSHSQMRNKCSSEQISSSR